MKVRDTWARWEAANAAALFVVFDAPDRIRADMLDGLDPDALPFAVLVDRTRQSYRDYGLTRAPWWRVWLDPAVYAAYWRLLRAGERLRAGGEDVRQLGGDFIVDRAGRLAYVRPQWRDDRPAVGELLRVMAERG